MMYTYTLVYDRPDVDPGEALEAHFPGVVQSPPLYQVQSPRLAPVLQGYLEGLGLTPTRVLLGDLAATQRQLDLEANDPQYLGGQRALAAINDQLVQPTTDPLSVDKVVLYHAAKALGARLVRLERQPDLATLESEVRFLATQQVGLIPRWVALEEDQARLGTLLDGPLRSYYANPRYRGRAGMLRLVVTALIHEYMGTYATTDPADGELLEGMDEATHDLGWELINFIDGEYDLGQAHGQAILEAQLAGHDLTAATVRELPTLERYDLLEDVDAALTDAFGTNLAMVRQALGLPPEN